LKWRDKHAGHRVDPKLEKSAAVRYFAPDGRLVKVEGKVTAAIAPEAEASTELQDLLSRLMNHVRGLDVSAAGSESLLKQTGATNRRHKPHKQVH
jgi:hypothetical protein